MGQFLLDYDYDKKKYVSVIRYKKFTDLGVELNMNETLLFREEEEENIPDNLPLHLFLLTKTLDCINLLIDIRCPAQLETIEPLLILIQISFAFVGRADVYWRCHAVLENVEV